jgi:isocitrate dehydrogenase
LAIFLSVMTKSSTTIIPNCVHATGIEYSLCRLCFLSILFVFFRYAKIQSMQYTLSEVPGFGQPIVTLANMPNYPIIPFIAGDGIGPEVWSGARRVLDAAVRAAYGERRRIAWMEVFAGQTALDRFNSWLPDETLQALKEFCVGIKGPLETPVGGGIRSLNVALRRELDLYVCQRPVRWLPGTPAPVRSPQLVDMVIFRENTEDLYAGIEFEAGSDENERLKSLLRQNFPDDYARLRFPDSSGIGIKPISRQGSQRLVRAALQWALANCRRSVTLVHKGNIMKFTEGAFRTWGYDLAESEFGGQVYTRRQWEKVKITRGEEAANEEQYAALAEGRLLIKDIIADAMFEAALLRPADFDVLATTNLTGDYLSDALAAQVGGIGIAPGANINYESGQAVFEATHGTAPSLAGKNLANPSSLILSGEMLLRYLGWEEAAGKVRGGLESAIVAQHLTVDLADQVEGATRLGTAEFATSVIERL